MQGTTTVFVTVYPTSPVSSAGGSFPGASGPDQAGTNTPFPTRTIRVSPVDASQATLTPFTTLTIDIWGDGPDSEVNPGTNTANPATGFPANGSPVTGYPVTGSPVSGGYGGSNAAPWPANTNSAGPNGSPEGTGAGAGSPIGAGLPTPGSGSGSPWYSVVTDTNVYWTTGSAGPYPVTVLSPQTIPIGAAPTNAPSNGQSLTCITTVGADGRPTVLEWPVGNTQGNGGQPITAGAGTPGDNASGFPQGASTIGSPVTGAPGMSTAGTTFTVIGTDGLPTVVYSSWVVPQGVPVTGGSGSLPTVFPVPGQSQNAPNGGQPITSGAPQGVTSIVGPPWPGVSGGPGMSTAATTFTVIGADGVPTIVHSSWLVPQGVPVTGAPAGLPTVFPAPGQPQNAPNDAGITACTRYTFLGPDGKPTVVESTLVFPGPANTVAGNPGNPPNGVPIPITPVPGSPGPVESGDSGSPLGVLTSATYTVLGTDGHPTIVATTFVVPGPFNTPVATVAPGGIITVAPAQATGGPGSPQPANVGGAGGVTTCITYTATGPDGIPTVVESTFVIPASAAAASSTAPVNFPTVVSGQPTYLPQGISAGNLATTAVTVDILGPNGVATPVVETVVFTPAGGEGTALPTGSSLGYPPMYPQPQQTTLPQGIPPLTSVDIAVATVVTVQVLGPNGIPTPVVETILLTPSAPGVSIATAAPVGGAGQLPGQSSGPVAASGVPSLDAYGPVSPDEQTMGSPSAVVSGVGSLPPGAGNGASTPTFTVVVGPNGVPVLSAVTGTPAALYGGSGVNGPPASTGGQPPANGYGWPTINNPFDTLTTIPAPQAAGGMKTIQTSTWTNVIPQQTTTYTINFPVTTLTTVVAPAGKRAFRRQARPSLSVLSWSNSTATSSSLTANTSLGSSLSSALGAVTTVAPPEPFTSTIQIFPSTANAGSGGVSPTMCPVGGQVGNTTVNFDNVKPGPLLNPDGEMWFSQGFLVVPLSASSSQCFSASSGGQLVEFVPPSLAGAIAAQGSSDVAEIGVGPNSANPCFRFDFFSADLGCAAQGNEQWREFEVSAYAYDGASATEQSIAWSETKRVPACPDFPHGGCSLTPVEFEGYRNITSVLITLHVGLELRAWWGDDFKFGWTDNTCDAANCRACAAPHRVERTAVESAVRRGVWHWTPAGLQRLADEYIWGSLY